MIEGLVCSGCGAAEVVVIDPGSEAAISEASDIMLRRGRPVTARCLACWPVLVVVERPGRRRSRPQEG